MKLQALLLVSASLMACAEMYGAERDGVRRDVISSAPQFSMSKKSIDFGYPYEGTYTWDSVMVYNKGNAALVITDIQERTGRYKIFPSNASVLPSDSCKFYVRYYAAISYGGQSYASNFIFSHNALPSPDTLAVDGWWRPKYFRASPNPLNLNDCIVGSARSADISVGSAAYGIKPMGRGFTIDSIRCLEPWLSVTPSSGTYINPQPPLTFHLTCMPRDTGYQTGRIIFYHTIDDFKDTVFVTAHVVKQPAPWAYTNTGRSHTVVIPLSANPTIGGVPLAAGDYLGAFYDSLGTPACAGAEEWSGTRNIAIAIFGDDQMTGGKDGFEYGESFTWKIFRKWDKTVFDGSASYSPVSGIITNTNTFADNGISQLSALTSADRQSVFLNPGWSLVSSRIDPTQLRIDSLFHPIASSVIMMKNGAGKSWIPQMSVDLIGNWRKSEGYQIKMASGANVAFEGMAIVPEAAPIAMPAGWSIIPYYYAATASPVDALKSLSSNIVIVKDQAGKTYLPQYEINSIGAMKPGEAYQIKLVSPSVFSYPPSSSVSPASLSKTLQTPAAAFHYPVPVATNHNATIVFLASVADKAMQTGDEVGAFARSGAFVGRARYEGKNFALTVWGDDPLTPEKEGAEPGEEIILRLWHDASHRESELGANAWSEGGAVYEPDGINVPGSVTAVEHPELPDEFMVMQNYPNPFNSGTNLRFATALPGRIRITIFNTLGQNVKDLFDHELEAGYHEVHFKAEGLPSGLYYYRIGNGASSSVKKMLLLR